MSKHVWMEHEEHHGRALLPDIPYWRANGWAPCDGPPPEPDLTRDPPDKAEKPTEAPQTPKVPGLLAAHVAGKPVRPEEG